MPWGIEERVAAGSLYLVIDEPVFIVGMCHANDVLLRSARNVETLVSVRAVVTTCLVVALGGVHHGAVAEHQRGLGIADGMVRELVIDMTPKLNLALLSRHGEGCADQCGQQEKSVFHNVYVWSLLLHFWQ